MYEPTSPRLARVKARISAANWESRLAKAREVEKRLMSVREIVAATGGSLNAAARKVASESERTWILRQNRRYEKHGLDGVIDARLPREPELTPELRSVISAAKMANRSVDADTVAAILASQNVNPIPAPDTLEKELKFAERRMKYAERKMEGPRIEVTELPLAGGELLSAAELETSVLQAMTAEVMAIGREAKKSAGGRVPTKDPGRNRLGQFTAKYNRARRRQPGETTASYLRPAAAKAVGRVPTWPRFVHEAEHTVLAKMTALTFGWGVAETKGWNALRSSRASGIGALTGYEYMPSTLSKLTSALSISGAGTRLVQAVGVQWERVAQKTWGEKGTVAALYIDNHAKEVWTSKLTLSGKVSHLNRVMPCITTTYVHTGAGAPLVASVQSGGAPLAARLCDLVTATEKQLGGDVKRALVVDSEGSTFDVLNSFVQQTHDPEGGRIIVTPLRPSRMPELEIAHPNGEQFTPYREHDEIRVGVATLQHKTTNRSLQIGTLEVRRTNREAETILLTNGTSLGVAGNELADLYFARWPLQENFFKNGKTVWLASHRGNCGEVVANVAIESKLERLTRQGSAARAKLATIEAQRPGLEAEVARVDEKHADASHELATRSAALKQVISARELDGRIVRKAAVRHATATEYLDAVAIERRRAKQKLDEQATQRETLAAEIQRTADEQKRLEPQRLIRELDVELDTVLTSTKLALLMLITFALKEYLPSMRMSPDTFLSRVLSIPGRREIVGLAETIIFYENPRDPAVSGVLRAACTRLNQRGLKREGRSLRYCVQPHPDAGGP